MIPPPIDDATRVRLQALRRKALPPKVRDRIEMVTLSDAGWSAPRIAAQLGYCDQTVRDALPALLPARLRAPDRPRRAPPLPGPRHRGAVPVPLGAAPRRRPSRPRCRGVEAVA